MDNIDAEVIEMSISTACAALEEIISSLGQTAQIVNNQRAYDRFNAARHAKTRLLELEAFLKVPAAEVRDGQA
jgi:hypothetical protein